MAKKRKQMDLPHVPPSKAKPDGAPIVAFRVPRELLSKLERKFKGRQGLNDACREWMARTVRK